MDTDRRPPSILLRARNLNGARTRTASLIALAAFAIHQLRYLIAAPGGRDLSLSVPVLAGHLLPLLAGIALAVLSAALLRSRIGGLGPTTDRRVCLASHASGIVFVFCCQQLLEGVLIAGHIGGLAAIFSSGGWAALPLAVLLGAIAALVDRSIEAIETRLGAGGPPVPSRRTVSEHHHHRTADILRLPAPLAFGLARRPPPACAR